MKKILPSLLIACFSFLAHAVDDEPKIGDLYLYYQFKIEVIFSEQQAEPILPYTTQYTPFEKADIPCDAGRAESCSMLVPFNFGKVTINVIHVRSNQLVGTTTADIIATGTSPCDIVNGKCDGNFKNKMISFRSPTSSFPLTISINDLNMLVNFNLEPNNVHVFYDETGKISSYIPFDAIYVNASTTIYNQPQKDRAAIYTEAVWESVRNEYEHKD